MPRWSGRCSNGVPAICAISAKPAFLHYALECMPKAHHICSRVRFPYRFLKFNAATKQPNAPFTLQHIRSAFSHKNL